MKYVAIKISHMPVKIECNVFSSQCFDVWTVLCCAKALGMLSRGLICNFLIGGVDQGKTPGEYLNKDLYKQETQTIAILPSSLVF